MDLDALLASRDGDEPSGENLEYDFDFMQLQIAATPGQEKQAGSEILAAEDPDFRDVEARAIAVLERSHDLRGAVILAAAVLHTRGMIGFAEVMTYIRRCLDENWDTCHPQLDADDDDDPTMRINAVKGLAGADTVLSGLRRAALTQSRNFGRLTLRDMLIASGEIVLAEGQDSVDKATIAAAFVDTGDAANAATLSAIKSAQADAKAIEGIFGDRTPGYGPDLDDLRRMLGQMARFVGEHAGSDAPAEAEDDDATSPAPRGGGGGGRRAPAGGGGGGAMPGSIETADDARAALDKVIGYFQRYEPSSPVPIILERAKRLVGADFITIMKDMAPDGLGSVRMIGGLSEDDDDDD
jgi:type VI secretion system protein ImpA